MEDGRSSSGRGSGRPDGGAPGGSARPVGIAGGERKGRRRGKRQPTTVGANPGGKGPLENVVVEEEEEEDEDDLAEVVLSGENCGGGTHIIGTCVLMCPPAERELRVRKNDIELFERRDPNDRNSSDETLAVKKYTRIVDNVTPDMVRTRDALAMTASYLYGLLDDRPEVPFMLKSKFLWDRLRSVRQDLSLQAITDGFAERLLEQMARFAILSEHELCEETATVANPDGHNSHLNVEQLAKTLTSLRHMYDDRAARGVGTDCPGAEAEMFAFQLLLRIDSHGRYNVQRSEMLNDLRSARPAVLLSSDVQLALAANRAYHADNIVEFFRLVQRASYLQACVLHKYFSKMRSRALEVMNATYGKQAMPLAEVARLLHTSAEEAEALAAHHGLTVQTRRRGQRGAAPSPDADAATRGKVLMIRDAGFIEPADEFPILRSPIVDAKRASTYLAEIVPQQSGKSARVPPKTPKRLAVPKPKSVAATSSSPGRASAAVSGLKAKQAATEADMETLRAALAAKEAEIKRRKEKLAAAQKAEPTKAALPREPEPRDVGKSDPPPTASPKLTFALTPTPTADERGNEPAVEPVTLNKRAVPFSPAARGAFPVAFPLVASPEPSAERNRGAPVSPIPAGPAGLTHPEVSAAVPEAVGARAVASPVRPPSASRLREDAAAAEAAEQKQARETAEAEARRVRENAARLEREAARRVEAAEAAEAAERAARAERAVREAAETREREAKEKASREAARRKREERARAVAAALEAARRAARRAEKSRKARLALAIFRWRRRARFQAHARREARIAASRATASPIPGIGRSAFRGAPLSGRETKPPTGSVSRSGLSAALAALGAKLDAARNTPWGAPLDVPRILVDAVARDAGTTPARALGHLSHWKLLTCSGGGGDGDGGERAERETRSTRAWVRAKLSRGRGAEKRAGAGDDGALLSLYASRPLAAEDGGGPTGLDARADGAGDGDATLWVCVRDVDVDAPPASYAHASAALFVLRLAPRRGHPVLRAIPSAEEARLRAFASSLARGARPRRALPLLVLVEGEGDAAAAAAASAAIASAVASAVAAGTALGTATPAVAVRVESIGVPIAAGASGAADPAKTLWARRDDVLAGGLRWAASVAPPEPFFRAAYLRDEVRDALARRGGTPDAAAATPAACVHAWNDAAESVRARLASARGSGAPRGVAAEFAAADTPGAFLRRRGGALARSDAASETILASAKLPPFPDARSGATLESLVGSYLSALDPAEPLPPGALPARLAQAGLAGPGGRLRVPEEADPRRPHRVWTAVFREIFARRLADIEIAQRSSGAGPACVAAAMDETTLTKAPPSDLPTRAPDPDPATRWPAETRKTLAEVPDRVAPASAKKRRRVDSDERVAPLSLETAFPRLARAKAEVENFEAWLSRAASPTPHAGGVFDDAAAKLRKLAGLGDLKTISF